MQTNNKQRETLESVAKQLIDATEDKNFGEDILYLVGCMRTMSRECRAALAAPVRNCEVGTAEEQAKRLNEWCNGRHCINCRFKGGWPDECKLKWAQLPYVEGKNDGSK